MGICFTSEPDTKRKKENNQISISSKTLTEFRKNYYSNKISNSNLEVTSTTSNKEKIEPPSYSLDKFGILIKTNQRFSRPLKFIFNLNNFKCKMLTENTLYILHVIFDGKDFPMAFGKGNNPTFMFNQTFCKEITFERMSKSYLEVYLYTYKSNLNDKRNLDYMTKAEILSESQIFSCLKINLLTLALAPEKHDLALKDPKRSRVLLGRITYCVSCKHIEDINLKIKKFRINLNDLKYNDIALKFRLENKNFNRQKESIYTNNLIGEPNSDGNKMIYEYPMNQSEDILDYNLSESLFLKDINKTKKTNEKNEKEEDLYIHGKMSMVDLYNSDVTLNIFSVRLQKNEELNQKKDSFFMKKVELPDIAKMSYKRNKISENSELVNIYTLIGIISLNFNKILIEVEEKQTKFDNLLFQSMLNKNNGLVKTLSGSKILKFGIEEDLTNKVQSHTNIYDFNIDPIQYKIENYIINIFNSENLEIIEDIYWEGEPIGNINLTLEITNLPLIHQIRFGVMTETGFELNSIFLYDNLNLSDNLPQDILNLIKFKKELEQDIDFSILKKIKKCLENSSYDKDYLYYGYNNNEDLYQSQAVIIDLGLGLFDQLDRIQYEYLHITFEIFKLIFKRAEFDLDVLSRKWFKQKISLRKESLEFQIQSSKNRLVNNDESYIEDYEYEFYDGYLITRKVIEKFLNFHYEILHYCLNNLNKITNQNISKDNMEFTYFYLAIAFFQHPQFRTTFVNEFSKNINPKEKRFTKFIKRMNGEFISRKVSLNSNYYISWDNLFYPKLHSAINTYLSKLNRKSSDNITKSKIENINLIKEQLMNIKSMLEPKKESENLTNNFNYNKKLKWYEKINKRDYISYDLILKIFDIMNDQKDKLIYQNKSSDLINFKNSQKMSQLYPVEKILKAVSYDLIIKRAEDYPKQIKELIPKLYADSKMINHFIYIIITTTNVYDTSSIFIVVEILDYLFNKKYEYNDFRESYLKEEIDISIMKKAFFILVESDNSLAIAKFIWFYYKNNSLINFHHMEEILKYILSIFFKLFFHWSYQVREIFYYFIVFILCYKLKKQIKSKNENKTVEMDSKMNTNKIKLDSKFTIPFSPDFIMKQKMKRLEYFYILDELKENMEIIDKLQKIKKNEKYQDISLDDINDTYISDKIPKQPHGSIIECIKQYQIVVTWFDMWENYIKEEKIPEDKIEYPKMEITKIKDDKIQY